MSRPAPTPTLWTVGHGARSEAELLALLAAHGIATLVDVRRMPQSRRHPHFGRERLSASLVAAGVRYQHRPGLGGMREPDGSDTNAGIREPAFRGYADYMQTPGFAAELAALIADAAAGPTAVLCAESDPAHCHRSFIADALLARRLSVLHIRDTEAAVPHVLRRGARIEGMRVAYPASQTELGLGPPGR
jgi:uncharacterized protein (DUF488 family)